MAIYGVNFNNTHIPESFAKLFPRTIRRVECNHEHPGNYPTTGRGDRIGSFVCCMKCKEEYGDAGGTKFVGFNLQGVATSQSDRDLMLMQADNGHRLLHSMKIGDVYGIYVY